MEHTTPRKEKVVAIRSSIKKWELLCSGELPVLEINNKCGLCHYTLKIEESHYTLRIEESLYNYTKCTSAQGRLDKYICRDHCPLAQSGYGCLEEGSVWNKIRRNLILLYTLEPNKKLHLKNEKHCADLFEEIYNALCDLDPEYDCRLEHKNTTSLKLLLEHSDKISLLKPPQSSTT